MSVYVCALCVYKFYLDACILCVSKLFCVFLTGLPDAFKRFASIINYIHVCVPSKY